ncbi:MAG: hypothetical protein M1352_03035 [Patescibacteria group bacterium]|nr:hypothetical protein [Patescibacteria group bacterium]
MLINLKAAFKYVLRAILVNKEWLIFWLIIALLGIWHICLLFGQGDILAGGDNYSYLFLGRRYPYPYLWDNYYSFGTRNFALPDLLGLPLYSYLVGFISAGLFQRILIFSLQLIKYVFFIKLASLLFNKERPSKHPLVFLLPCLLLSFNAFASLNPFTYTQLMYDAYLPLSLYYFIKLYESKKNDFSLLAKIVIFAVIFSPINSNPALSLTVYVPQAIYFLLNLKNLSATRVARLVTYGLAVLVSNLWWIFSMFFYFSSLSNDAFAQGKYFLATQVGSLFQNFRFIGQWGWYAGHFLHLYYPYSQYYDNPAILITTYSIVFAALYEATKHEEELPILRNKLFLLGLTLVSLLLVNGARPPLGFFYQVVFNGFSLFKIFREPFTKFSELYVLSLSLFFYLFLNRVLRWRSRGVKLLAIAFFIFAVGTSIKPDFLGEGVISYWNGSVRTVRVRLPGYWLSLEEYAKRNLAGTRVLDTPRFFYGGAWNWPQGFSSADDVAASFLNDNVNVIRPTVTLNSDESLILDNFYMYLKNGLLERNYLSLMGIDYVLQENDFDWRYTGGGSSSPRKTTEILDKFLIREATFGKFDESYLAKIPNEDPSSLVRNSLYPELLGLPALVLYKVPKETVPPKLYTARRIIATDGSSVGLGNFFTANSFQPGDALVFDDTVLSKVLTALTGRKPSPLTSNIYSFSDPPEIVFREINPTEYVVQVKSASAPFLLLFQESFDGNWEISPNFANSLGGWLAQVAADFQRDFGITHVSDQPYHFESNGFSNGWVINPNSTFFSKLRVAGISGGYDLSFVLHFRGQLYLELLFGLTGLVFGLSVFYLSFIFVKSLSKRLADLISVGY